MTSNVHPTYGLPMLTNTDPDLEDSFPVGRHVGQPAAELWMVEIDYMPEYPNPEQVDNFLAEQIERGVPVDRRGFYWPSNQHAYRSQSGARRRLDLFECYGARGHLVRCRTQWERVETKDQRIARLETTIRELLEGTAS